MYDVFISTMSSVKEKFVIPSLTGGLGSRLFQIASAISYGEHNKRTPILHDVFIQQDISCHVDDLFPSLEHSHDSSLLHNVTTLPDIYPLRPSVSNVVVLEGDFQDSRYFYEDVIIEFPHCFRPIPELAETAFLHIRVRDIPPERQVKLIYYYATALKKLPDSVDIMVFSDDIDWCKEHVPKMFLFIEKSRWQWEPDGLADVEALYMMSQCKGGAICANSAFSWWGAYLGCRTVKAPVYMPIKWFLEKESKALFVLPHWAKVIPPWAKSLLC